MRALINSVKDASLQCTRASCNRTFLDHTVSDPTCQRIASHMMHMTPEQLGVDGPNDPYHFQGNLNRVTITGENSEDYRLVLFFIKKGTRMPLHDHPNMSVFFRLVFGQLKYRAYDKLDSKFQYNDFVEDEYEELLHSKKRILARKSRLMTLREDDLLFVRPSRNNMHEFVAEENSCFFDICLPNYTPANSSRRITYFKEEPLDKQRPCEAGSASKLKGGLTELVYDTTPPVMPVDFHVHDLDYRGCYQ